MPAYYQTLEMYEAIDRLQKPVIASVNGFAVGGGNVFASGVRSHHRKRERNFSPKVGPMMGSFECGLRHVVSGRYCRKEAGKREIWYANRRSRRRRPRKWALINRVVPDDQLAEKTREFALEVADRGAFALASVRRHSTPVMAESAACHE